MARSTFRESFESFGAHEEEGRNLGLLQPPGQCATQLVEGLAQHWVRVPSYQSSLAVIGLSRLVYSLQSAFEGYYHQYWLLL